MMVVILLTYRVKTDFPYTHAWIKQTSFILGSRGKIDKYVIETFVNSKEKKVMYVM